MTAVGKAGMLDAEALGHHEPDGPHPPKRLVVDVGWDGGVGDVHPGVYTTPGCVQFVTPVPGGCGPLQMAVLLYRLAVASGCHRVHGVPLDSVFRSAFSSQLAMGKEGTSGAAGAH